jgi:hypothetical protein
VRNYEGYMSAYMQPEVYRRHDPATCPACQQQRASAGENGQEGVAALLSGKKLAIQPEGFETTHRRLARIDWAPLRADLAAEKILSRNGHGRKEAV